MISILNVDHNIVESKSINLLLSNRVNDIINFLLFLFNDNNYIINF